MLRLGGFAACAALLVGSGCVSVTDYERMKDRYDQQQQYVERHKDEVRELEKRQQLLALQMREKEKDCEALRARLATSERMREDAERQHPKDLAVSEQPAAAAPATDVSGGFKVNPETNGIVLEHDVLFSPGKSTLKESGRKALDELISRLNGPKYEHFFIRVDGHTDDQPVHLSKKENHDNWELGAKRAKAVLDYMIAHGVAPERCFYASFAWYRPFKQGDRAQNRRVEIVLFEKKC